MSELNKKEKLCLIQNYGTILNYFFFFAFLRLFLLLTITSLTTLTGSVVGGGLLVSRRLRKRVLYLCLGLGCVSSFMLLLMLLVLITAFDARRDCFLDLVLLLSLY